MQIQVRKLKITFQPGNAGGENTFDIKKRHDYGANGKIIVVIWHCQ
jgi:hypothetical protein